MKAISQDVEDTAIIIAEMTLDAVKMPGPVGFQGVNGIAPIIYFSRGMREEHTNDEVSTGQVIELYNFHCRPRLPIHLRG